MKTVVILGTLDTKSAQIGFVAEEIKSKGYQVILMDMSTGTGPSHPAEITCDEIAKAAGATIEEIRASRDRDKISKLVIEGASKKANELLESGKLDGIMAIGGYSAATICTRVMKSLPFGLPKLMVSSAAGLPVPDVGGWFGTSDITMMNTLVDLVRLNKMVKSVLNRAAGAICGMLGVAMGDLRTILSTEEPLVAVSVYGPSENCGQLVCELLERRGYGQIVFHAQGVGDRAMEDLIAQGFFDGVVDMVLGGVSDEILEGGRAAGPYRLESAGARGIPQVVAPSGSNMTGAGPMRKNREKYISRQKVLKIDDIRVMVRLNEEEMRLVADTVAEKLNKAKGPVQFFMPLRGWSSWERENSILHAPELDKIFLEQLKKRLKPGIKIIEIDSNLEDSIFATAMVEAFDEMMKGRKISAPSRA
jgi:uncharacterized protein (UPF0261 family)